MFLRSKRMMAFSFCVFSLLHSAALVGQDPETDAKLGTLALKCVKEEGADWKMQIAIEASEHAGQTIAEDRFLKTTDGEFSVESRDPKTQQCSMWSLDPCYKRFISDKDFEGKPFQQVTATHGSGKAHWVFQEASQVVHVQHPPVQEAHIFTGDVLPLSVLLQKNHDLSPHTTSILTHALFDKFDATKRLEALMALSSGCVYYEDQVQKGFDQNAVWRIDPTQWNWTFGNAKDSLEKIAQSKEAFKRFGDAFTSKSVEKAENLYDTEDARQLGIIANALYKQMSYDEVQDWMTKTHLATLYLNTLDPRAQKACVWDTTKTAAIIEQIFPNDSSYFTLVVEFK